MPSEATSAWLSAALGSAVRELGRPDESVAIYRHLLEQSPTNMRAHLGLGTALRHQGKLDEAIAEFREAVRLGPDDAPAFEKLIAALLTRRKRDEVHTSAVAGTSRLDREFARALEIVMAPLLTRVRPDEGMALLDDLIREQPGQARFRVARARYLVALGRREEAAADFAQVLALPTTGSASFWADDTAGLYTAAVADTEVFEWLTRLRPEDRNLLAGRVRHLGRQREWRQAAEVATRFNALDPPENLSWHYEAGLLAWAGDREGYRRVCRRMLERFGTNADPTEVRRTVLSCLLEPDGVAGLGARPPWSTVSRHRLPRTATFTRPWPRASTSTARAATARRSIGSVRSPSR